MGLRKKLLDVKPKELKNAHKIMKALSILGISEDDLLEIKNIPTLKKQIKDLESFRNEVMRIMRNESGALKESNNPMQKLIEMFNQDVEDLRV